MSECAREAFSNDYADFITYYTVSERILREQYNVSCIRNVGNRFIVAYAQRDVFNYDRARVNLSIPTLYTTMDSSAVESTGVFRIRYNPYLGLSGRGIMIGFVDTGIDYMNPLFMNADNTTRIMGLWDQGDESGTSMDVPYGRSYGRDEINAAIAAPNPYDIVAQTDDDGHGTFIAGLACGGEDTENDFVGMAPQAYIGVVKLKDAKTHLKEYYGVDTNVTCYQENDIMLGINYLVEIADNIGCPLVICIGVGSGLGDHNGTGFLGLYLDYLASQVGYAVCVAAGNEANSSRHYSGVLGMNEQFQDVEVRVGESTDGFTMQLWTHAPDVMAVGFTSPSGEVYDKIPAKVNESRQIRFLLENTIVAVDYWILQQDVGDELIEMRFYDPAPGIWKIRIYNEGVIIGRYDMWLPAGELMPDDTFFLRPDPDITVTEPGNADFVITVGGYDHVGGGIYIDSGRGFTRDGSATPDVVAPAVNVFGPTLRNRYTTKTGTSISAAICAGAAAMIQEWAYIDLNDIRMNGNVLRKYIIRGASRSSTRTYPDKEWGYGILDIYEVFRSLI